MSERSRVGYSHAEHIARMLDPRTWELIDRFEATTEGYGVNELGRRVQSLNRERDIQRAKQVLAELRRLGWTAPETEVRPARHHRRSALS